MKKAIKPSLKEIKTALWNFCKKRKLDPKKAILIAGGALYLHGLKDSMNDIDAVIPEIPKIYEGYEGIFEMDIGSGENLSPEMLDYVTKNGLRVQSKKGALAFYKFMNRPKDQRWIKLLEKELK